MIYVGADPGARMCGVAIEFAAPSHSSRAAFLVRSKAATTEARAVDMALGVCKWLPRLHPQRGSNLLRRDLPGLEVSACVEGQQFYGTERSKGDPNDLIKLGVVSGAILGALALHTNLVSSSLPLPREWKGTLAKGVHHERLAREQPQWVSAVERDTPKSMQHHVWDAVGLLIWHKRRTERRTP